MEILEGCRERKADSEYFVELPEVPSESRQMWKEGWLRLLECDLGFVSRGLYGWMTDIEGTENPVSAIMRNLSGNKFASIVY